MTLIKTCFLGSIAALSLSSCTTQQASFTMTNEFDIQVPKGAARVQAWLAMPQRDSEPAQKVSKFGVETEYAHSVVKDQFGNEYVYLDVRNPTKGTIKVKEVFDVERQEIRGDVDSSKARSLTDEEISRLATYLKPSRHIPVTNATRQLASSIVGSETNPLLAARKLYDWVLENIEYWVKDPANKKASPVGDAEYCLTTKTGNCTDFHSLYTSLARSAGIPTRMVYGSLAKPTLKGVDKDQSYHCWPETYIGGLGWISNDVAVPDIYYGRFDFNEKHRDSVILTTALGYVSPDPAMVDYYFGNLDARRVTWNRGRDLVMQGPRQAGGPINSMPKAYVEVDGKTHADWTRKLTYR